MDSKYFPLSSRQLDIYFDQIAYPDTPVYNIGGFLIMYGEVDFNLLEKAIQQLVAESDAFRLLFAMQNNEPVQFINNKIKGLLSFIDYSNSHKSNELTQTYLNQQFSIAFDISSAKPLWQFVLVKELHNKFYLLTKYHHLIADGWTTKIVIERLAELYNSLLVSKSSAKHSLDENKPISYFEFLTKERDYLKSKKYAQDKQYWFKQFNHLPDKLIESRYINSTKHGLSASIIQRFMIKRKDYNRLEHFAKEQNCSTYHLFLIMLSVYFSRIYQRTEIVIGLPGLNRSGVQFKKVPGLFISILPFVIKIDPGQSLMELLQQCTQQLRASYRHQKFPLSEINRHLAILQQGRNSLFDIVLSYERQDYNNCYGQAEIYAHQLFSGIARFPLGLTICEFHADNDVEIILEGAEDCFNASDLNLLSNRLKSLLSQVTEQPYLKVANVDLLSQKDKKILSHTEYTGDTTSNLKSENNKTSTDLLDCYYQYVHSQPEQLAVKSLSHSLTWSELDHQSNILAQILLQKGVSEDSIVAICLPRCVEMIVSIVAVLKSGAAWLPILADNPSERILQLYKNSGAQQFLTISSLQQRMEYILSGQEELITVDQLEQKPYIKDQSPIYKRNPQSLCYVLYTSGSTGQPKAVMVEYESFSQRIEWIRNNFSIEQGDNIAQSIAFNFDPALIEIFLALTSGACLKLLPENALAPQAFADFVVTQNIHFMALVPSSLKNLIHGLNENYSGKKAACSLKSICCGGEVLSSDLAKQFNETIGEYGTKLFNVYGPTEALIFATAWLCQDINHYPVLPLGQAISNTKILILNEFLQILPPGVVGEIAIGGSVLSRGYLNQPIETAKSFVNNSAGERIYLTGDCGYIGSDGLLYFQGRKDRQIKLSGYRIEPGEIETVIRQHSQVNQALVLVRQVHKQDRLLAYVESSVDVNKNEISTLLQQHLPAYMQPWNITLVKEFPLLSNGKIAIDLLPNPQTNYSPAHTTAKTDMEKSLLVLWQKTLKIQSISIHDNFFALGGDSLAAVNLLAKLDKLTDTKLSISLLLENPTIFQMAITLKQARYPENNPRLSQLGDHSLYNQDLFLMASGHGDSLRFRRLADNIANQCNLHMLQPALIPDEDMSIDDLAEAYADLILSYTDKPYYIAGFSIAGITALATAKILQQRGKRPKGVLLLDTIYPRWPKMSGIYFRLLSLFFKSLLLNHFVVNGRRLDVMLTDPGIKCQLKALKKYQIDSHQYKGEIALFISSKIWPKSWLFSPWSKLFAQDLSQYLVNGLHGGIFQEDNIHGLADQINDYLS